jgi:hypothetical protein
MPNLFVKLVAIGCHLLCIAGARAVRNEPDYGTLDQSDAEHHTAKSPPGIAGVVRQDQKFPVQWTEGMTARQRDLWEDTWDAG